MKKKRKYEYRLRWDDVVYEPGELKVIAYKNGKKWAKEVVKTTGEATQLRATAGHTKILADGKALSFIALQIIDNDGHMVPRSNNRIEPANRCCRGPLIFSENFCYTHFTDFKSIKN